MYISDTETNSKARYKAGCEVSLKTGMRYLTASLVIAAASAVYGLFSHGVYSYFMTYAFMIPLLCGALPHLTAAMKNASVRSGGDGKRFSSVKQAAAADLQLALIATLTTGSLLKGALDIYGTTSRLLIVYPVISILIIAAAPLLTRCQPGSPQRSR